MAEGLRRMSYFSKLANDTAKKIESGVKGLYGAGYSSQSVLASARLLQEIRKGVGCYYFCAVGWQNSRHPKIAECL